MKFHTFHDYVQWRLNEDERPSGIKPENALSWVLAAMNIKQNYNPKNKNDVEEVQNAISAPLSSYPEGLERLKSEPILQQDPDLWPKIQAALGKPDTTTVSDLANIIGSAQEPKRTFSDRPEQEEPSEAPPSDEVMPPKSDRESPL